MVPFKRLHTCTHVHMRIHTFTCSYIIYNYYVGDGRTMFQSCTKLTLGLKENLRTYWQYSWTSTQRLEAFEHTPYHSYHWRSWYQWVNHNWKNRHAPKSTRSHVDSHVKCQFIKNTHSVYRSSKCSTNLRHTLVMSKIHQALHKFLNLSSIR